MKRIIKALLLTLSLAGIISVASGSFAEEAVAADSEVSKLFETYYADGVYVKDTSIFMNETAVKECINYFHAKSTILEIASSLISSLILSTSSSF